ncbi:hypothetical protein JTB14_001259 [Gonioctena quinquepunctata]|nr:hypothetical protein JTB14_001259 [Gonioctena quinquepunctata]
MIPLYLSVKEIVIGLSITMFAFLFLDWWKKKRFEKKYGRNIPVISHMPIIGSTFLLLLQDVLSSAHNVQNSMKSSVYVWVFSTPLITSDPEELKIILTHRHSHEKGYIYRFFGNITPGSLIYISGRHWTKQRKLLSKCFKQKILDGIIFSFNNSCGGLSDQIDEIEGCKTLQDKSMDFFLHTFLGEVLKCDYKKSQKIDGINVPETIESSFRTMYSRLINPLYYYYFIFRQTTIEETFSEAFREIDSFCLDLIQMAKRRRLEPDYCREVDGVTILDVMDEAKVNFKNMMGELKFFGGAVAETSSKAIWFVLTMLALHTDIQEKVFEEVSEVVGKLEVVDHVIVRNLKYTEMVILETLRLFPPVPLLVRKVTEDLMLGELDDTECVSSKDVNC